MIKRLFTSQEYEQRLQDCERTLIEVEVNASAGEIECISGNRELKQ
jgi:hypothetical protein